MSDDETQAGSPPVVVPNPNEQSLRGHFERILLISEEAAASLAEKVIEVFTEKEEQARRVGPTCTVRNESSKSPLEQKAIRQ